MIHSHDNIENQPNKTSSKLSLEGNPTHCGTNFISLFNHILPRIWPSTWNHSEISLLWPRSEIGADLTWKPHENLSQTVTKWWCLPSQKAWAGTMFLSLPLLMVYLMIKLYQAQHHERGGYFNPGSDFWTLIFLVLMHQESKSCFPTQNHSVIDLLGDQAQCSKVSPQNQNTDPLLSLFPSISSLQVSMASRLQLTERCPVWISICQ